MNEENLLKMLGEMGDSPKTKSQFHGGFQFLTRLDEILQGLDVVTVRRQQKTNSTIVKVWEQNYSLLLTLFKELSAKMTDKELEKHENIHKIVKKTFFETRNKFVGDFRINMSFIDMFDEWEIMMRRLISEKGLLMPMKRSSVDVAEI